MADKEPAAAAPAASTSGSPRKQKFVTMAVILGLFGLEGGGVFFLTRMTMSGPATTEAGVPGAADGGATAGAADAPTKAQQGEIEIADCRPSNRTSGRPISFRVRVSVLADMPDMDRVKAMSEEKKARIADRINFVFRSAEPEQLAEPGLETVKRRIKHELDQIFGDDKIIREVLIPELIQAGGP